jgi:hypothetical protein
MHINPEAQDSHWPPIEIKQLHCKECSTALKTRLKILPVLTREHYTSLLHWAKYVLGGARWGLDGPAGARRG